MKELSIEEKAKAYDEAIEKAKEMIKAMTNIGGVAKVDDIQYLFPELKESEDEQHRKWILEYLYDGLRKSDEQFKDHFKCAIAWLEKQSKQKPAWSEEDENEVAILEAYIRSNDWSEQHVDRALGIVDTLVNKVKSLRPQNTWKPSVEEVVALEHAINCYSGISPTNANEVFILEIMKERLKNLTK